MNNTGITIAVGIVALIIGFFIGGMMAETDIDVPTSSTSTTTSTSQAQTAAEREAAFQAERQEQEENEVAFTINVSNLPEVQQTALAAMGVSSTSSIDITNKMVTCAGVDMSATRMAEIKNGASVTAGEGIKLMSCYRAN